MLAKLVEALRENGFWSDDVLDTFTPELERAVRFFQSTHVDENREHLTADGVVGPRTWWALENASGAAQSSEPSDLMIPAQLSPLRSKILTVALAEYAKKVVEEPNGRSRGPLVDRYLPAWAVKANEKGLAWCCFFFYSWVMKEALGAYPLGRLEGGCARARSRSALAGLRRDR